MAGVHIVNKSGVQIPVYSNGGYLESQCSGRIGTIYNNECCVYIGGVSGVGIYFKSTSGFRFGYISNELGDVHLNPNNGNEWNDYPYGTVTINGRSYKTLKARRDTGIFTPSGDPYSRYRYLKAGRRIAIDIGSNQAGNNYPYLILCRYYEKEDGKWYAVNGSYGFVDTGLRDHSMNYNTSLYGSF